MLSTHIACAGNQFSVHLQEVYILCSLILSRTLRCLSITPCLLKHETKLHIPCKVSPDYIDITTLMLQTTEHIIISTTSFQSSFHYTAPPSKGVRMLQWLIPISIRRVTYLKTRSHLCLFEKRILTTPFELPKETLNYSWDITGCTWHQNWVPKLKVCSSFTYLVSQGKKQFSQEASWSLLGILISSSSWLLIFGVEQVFLVIKLKYFKDCKAFTDFYRINLQSHLSPLQITQLRRTLF